MLKGCARKIFPCATRGTDVLDQVRARHASDRGRRDATPSGYRYTSILSPIEIQRSIERALAMGTRRQPWLAGCVGTDL